MPTYDATVLADSPLFYPKLQELPGTSDPTMHDASGNNDHGDLNLTTSPVVQLGLAGPIQTDASSLAAKNRIGRKLAASGSTLDLRGSQSWEMWGQPDGSLTPRTLLARYGIPTLTGSNIVYLSGTTLVARMAHASGDDWRLTYGGLVVGAWYHIVVTRNGNVMRLIVNGVLRDERTDLPGGSIVYSNYNNAEWSIGYSNVGSAIAFYSVGQSHVALYATALSESRARVHYEAALTDLLVSATISVRVVVELDTDQVDPIDFPFAHNFAEPLSGSPRPITEHLSYATNVNQSEPDYQQRINAQPHHVERILEYFVTPTSSRARAMLQAALWTPGQTYKLPICKDWGALTAQANASDATLSLDTTLRDYEVGSYVVVWEDVREPWTAQFFEITSRTDTELGISPSVGDVLPIGSPVMPARLAILPDDNLSMDSHLIDRETAALQFEILSTELSARRVTTYTPAGTYLGLEVFSLERAKVEWVDSTQYQINRRKEGVGTSAGNDLQRAVDTGSPQTVPLRVTLTSRASQAEFYGWMDARQGKQNPVWVVSEDNDLTMTARSAGSITIEYIGYTTLYNTHSARRHLAIKKTDGSVVYLMITASVDNGDGTETLSASSPPLLSQISKVSFLKRCTSPDQFELTHNRNGTEFISESSFVMTELLTTPEPA